MSFCGSKRSDNRKTLSYPEIRTYLRQMFVELITEQYGKPDVIAGVATGGIALGDISTKSSSNSLANSVAFSRE